MSELDEAMDLLEGSDSDNRYRKYWKSACILTWSVLVFNLYGLYFLSGLAYLYVGVEIARKSEWDDADPQFWLAIIFWIPILFAGFLGFGGD